MSQYQENATIIRFERLTQDNVRLTLQSDNIAGAAKPGQFVMVKAGSSKDPLLRRPFSIHQASRNGRLQILFKVTGRGTDLLARCREGEKISIFGPLGRGFNVDLERPACLVGGGMGIAPMLFLGKYICEHRKNPTTDHILFGGRTAEEVEPLVNDLKQLGLKLLTATDDGSYGHKGFVTDLMKAIDFEEGTVVYCCGPEVMMERIYRISEKLGLACQVSVESVMACGMGACLGCNIPSADGHYVHVCYEGPVFRAEDLVWES